ncbi:MAG TPA: 3-phosphoshikimate 1-carboxyvinyltransferase [Tepidisphaeraceae bacterium]|nr:3-phosphoshikimate 1-carboxyvinyltransferase [Tepidisphaeraceae bacterium]
MLDVRLDPITSPVNKSVTPPGSKSLTNRALVLAALAQGRSTLSNVLFADDTQVMIDSLKQLGFAIDVDVDSKTISVEGLEGQIPAESAELFVGNSGTTIRFLAALCTLGVGRFSLDGIERMRERPIGQLIDLLKNLGARISYSMNEGFPPIEIRANKLGGGFARFGASASSQFLSAVLMVAPNARHEVHILLEPNQTSWPYVAMTMRLMDQFGVTPELERDPKTSEPTRIVIPRHSYIATNYEIEPDASNASYFVALAAIHPKSKIKIRGLTSHSLQGDAMFAEKMKQTGLRIERQADGLTIIGPEKLDGFDVDFTDIPDTAQTAAVIALFASEPSTLRGLRTLRVKETDRIEALKNELTKLGAKVIVKDDTMTIAPPRSISPAEIDTYNDHRMAMSFAIAATRAPGIVIRDAECVNKTYPEFFEDLKKLLS